MVFVACRGLQIKVNRDKPPTLQWINVSFVCRRWREIALGSYQLWDTVSPNWSMSCVVTMLERSGTAPLDLDGMAREDFTPEQVETLAVILIQSHRIRYINL